MLKNKIVFITGASSGIGEACAQVFAEQGANLVLCARRLDKIKLLAEQLQQKYSIKTKVLQFDVQNYAMIQQALTSLAAEWQTPDILINNAGLALGLDKLQEGDVHQWEQMIDTNIKGLLFATRLLLPPMVKRKQGQIINIGSISGHAVYSGGTVYCATKHAVRAITEGLQLDLLGTQVKVSV